MAELSSLAVTVARTMYKKNGVWQNAQQWASDIGAGAPMQDNLPSYIQKVVAYGINVETADDNGTTVYRVNFTDTELERLKTADRLQVIGKIFPRPESKVYKYVCELARDLNKSYTEEQWVASTGGGSKDQPSKWVAYVNRSISSHGLQIAVNNKMYQMITTMEHVKEPVVDLVLDETEQKDAEEVIDDEGSMNAGGSEGEAKDVVHGLHPRSDEDEVDEVEPAVPRKKLNKTPLQWVNEVFNHGTQLGNLAITMASHFGEKHSGKEWKGLTPNYCAEKVSSARSHIQKRLDAKGVPIQMCVDVVGEDRFYSMQWSAPKKAPPEVAKLMDRTFTFVDRSIRRAAASSKEPVDVVAKAAPVVVKAAPMVTNGWNKKRISGSTLQKFAKFAKTMGGKVDGTVEIGQVFEQFTDSLLCEEK